MFPIRDISERETETVAGELAPWVKCFTTQDKDSSVICRTHLKKPGMTVYVCNLSAGEAETGRALEGSWATSLYLAEFQSSSAGLGRGAVCVLFQTESGRQEVRRLEVLKPLLHLLV